MDMGGLGRHSLAPKDAAALSTSAATRPPKSRPSKLKGSQSAPLLLPSLPKPPPKTKCTAAMNTRQWAPEHKRLLHEDRERRWLTQKARHQWVDFSDSERTELRRYFDALREGADKLSVDRLEDMMVSLGLADSRQEVERIVEAIDGDRTGELDFEEYLLILRTRADPGIFRVFKMMMEGKLGDRDLPFQMVMSAYRREHILGATGAPPRVGQGTSESKQRCDRILRNFATLQRRRHEEGSLANLMARFSNASEEDVKKALEWARGKVTRAAAKLADQGFFEDGRAAQDSSAQLTAALPFENDGHAQLGGLEMMWRGICHEKGLIRSRPSSADGPRRKPQEQRLQRPESPSAVIAKVMKTADGANKRAPMPAQRSCIVVEEAPVLLAGGGKDEEGKPGARRERSPNGGYDDDQPVFRANGGLINARWVD